MDYEESQSEESISPESTGERLKNRVLKPGESFGNFRVVKCQAAGLIANYYHMQHVRDLHDVTVGIFHHRVEADDKFLKRLQALQKNSEGFQHEAIPKIVDCAVVNERTCIFLETVKGQSLSQYFSAHGSPGNTGIDSDAVTRLVAQLLGAVGYAHSQGVDHRDLDSDMIFVKEDGSLQVLGLGIKAALGVELFESIVSASVSPLVSNKTVGRINSFDIMSPEYKGGKTEDSRVDVYGVGVLGYWLLTGQKFQLSKWVAPSALVKGLSSKWDDFFEKSLERDNEIRFQSCKIALIGLKDADVEADPDRAGFVQRQIDRIPVLKGIVERGELVARVYRLSLIGVVGLTLTALAASFLGVAFTETEEYVREVAQEVGVGEAPTVRVKLSPPFSKLQFVGYSNKFIAIEGAIGLLVQPGDYKLLITAPHHVEQEVALHVPVEGSGDTIDLEVALKPSWTDFKITSEPGAAISVIDDRGIEIDLGVVDGEGNFSIEKGIFARTYQIVVKKEGYTSRTLDNHEIEFDTANEVQVDLVPLPSSVTIRTEPTGARILINDVLVGVSPVTVDDVEPAEHYLVIAHYDGYRSVGRRIEIEAGEAKVVDFGALFSRSGELTFDVTFEGISVAEALPMMGELSVEVDGDVFPYGSHQLSALKEGPHNIQLLHPQYRSEAQEVTIVDREVAKIDVQLFPRPGVVELVLPKAFKPEVLVNHEEVTLTDGVVEVPAGETVELELRIQNHLTMSRKVELAPNERFVWEVEPVAIPGPTVGQSWTMPYLGHEFAWVGSGQFSMGSPPTEPARLPNEGPETQIQFTEGFWAAIYEVTQAQFIEIMDRNPSEFLGLKKPVVNVTWKEAKQFCELLTHFEKVADHLPEGYVYRLPTEAEWECLARAGTQSPFSFGDTADATRGNFRGVYPASNEKGVRATAHYGTVNVGSYSANPWGIYDVHGNAQEWTLDIYNGRLPGGRLVDPAPRTEGQRIAVRGGSWENFAPLVRSASRAEVRPDTQSNAIGFRVVLAPAK